MKVINLSFVIALFFTITMTYAQSKNTRKFSKEKIDKKEPPKFFRAWKEHFYKEDSPIGNEIDPKEEKNFYMVKYQDGKVQSIAYYVRSGGALRIIQNVNFDALPYFFSKYQYNKKAQLINKQFNDENDKEIAFYKYIWNDRINVLERVEKWGKTLYLEKKELKSYNEYTWEEDQLKTFTFYNKRRLPVEKYYFIKNPDTGENKAPKYLVGNNKISMFVLEKYERFRVRSGKETRSFYIIYKQENNLLKQEKYNNDGVLIEEMSSIEIPQKEKKEK